MAETNIWEVQDNDAGWDAIHASFVPDAVFMDSVRRRNAQIEMWGIFIWGGIFDSITGGMPFPFRKSDCD